MLALLKPAYDNLKKCAVFLVSYTACYKAESVPNILSYLGYSDNPTMLTVYENRLYDDVYAECIKRIKARYPEAADDLDLKSSTAFVTRNKRGISINKKAMGEHLLMIFDKYIRKDVACAMQKLDLPCGKDIRNVFYKPMYEDVLEVNRLVRILSKSGVVLTADGSISNNKDAVMHQLETYRIKALLFREVLPLLKSTTNDKIVITTKHISSINFINETLTSNGYTPLIITGVHTPSKVERNEIVEKFESHDNVHRILIGTSQILSTGCSLDDTHGDYPRWLFVCPTFKFADMAQTPNRVYRRSTKSRPTISFVYLASNPIELTVLLNMKTKGHVMGKTVALSMANDMPLLPAELSCVIHETGRKYSDLESLASA
jgi:hypothetical protein